MAGPVRHYPRDGVCPDARQTPLRPRRGAPRRGGPRARRRRALSPARRGAPRSPATLPGGPRRSTSYPRRRARRKRRKLGPLCAQSPEAILDFGEESVAAADGQQAQLLGLERLEALERRGLLGGPDRRWRLERWGRGEAAEMHVGEPPSRLGTEWVTESPFCDPKGRRDPHGGEDAPYGEAGVL